MVPLRTALTIAGSDSSGGAGIQADLKTFMAHRVFGMAAITALTSQNTRGVRRVDEVPVDGVRAQIEAVFDDLPVGAVKIGMLGTAAHVEAVATALRGRDVPIVLDPVMVASTGHRLLAAEAEAAIRELLLPLSTLITPNLPEAVVLSGCEDVTGQHAWALEQPTATLLTGGDGTGATVTDTLLQPGLAPRSWSHPKRGDRPFHGTGCTLSSAIAARLARQQTLEEAVGGAIAYVQGLVRFAAATPALGGGHPPLLHGLEHALLR